MFRDRSGVTDNGQNVLTVLADSTAPLGTRPIITGGTSGAQNLSTGASLVISPAVTLTTTQLSAPTARTSITSSPVLCRLRAYLRATLVHLPATVFTISKPKLRP